MIQDIKFGVVAIFIGVFALPFYSFAACPSGKYQSTTYLSTLLEGNQFLQVSSENAELKLRNGSIRINATASIYANGGGISFTGTGELKARGTYLLQTRGRKRFIKVDSVSADIFKTVLYIGGVESSRTDYRSLVFRDRSIQYRCENDQLILMTRVNGANKTFTFQPI